MKILIILVFIYSVLEYFNIIEYLNVPLYKSLLNGFVINNV